MILDPEIQWILTLARKTALPPVWQLSPTEARAQYRKSAGTLDFRRTAFHESRDLQIPGEGGEIPARLLVPREPQAGERMPLLLFFHGGGFVIGDLETHRGLYTRLAREADCLVLAVDYRLAPEHPFPAAVVDAWAALDFVFREAESLGADPRRIAVGGDSAGGTLSAVTALYARDRGLSLCQQILLYPGTAPRPDHASHFQFAEGYLLDRLSILWFYQHYLGGVGREDWRFAPLLAESLAGVAPATVVVAGGDPLRNEGLAYARRLSSAEVPVDLRLYPGAIHGFLSMGGLVPMAREAVMALGRRLHGLFWESSVQ